MDAKALAYFESLPYDFFHAKLLSIAIWKFETLRIHAKIHFLDNFSWKVTEDGFVLLNFATPLNQSILNQSIL